MRSRVAIPRCFGSKREAAGGGRWARLYRCRAAGDLSVPARSHGDFTNRSGQLCAHVRFPSSRRTCQLIRTLIGEIHLKYIAVRKEKWRMAYLSPSSLTGGNALPG